MVTPSERPYQIILSVFGLGVKRSCGGSLIKNDWVLISAHCLMEDKDCDDKTILQHIKLSAGRESRAEKGPGIQEILISPTDMDKNVFFDILNISKSKMDMYWQ